MNSSHFIVFLFILLHLTPTVDPKAKVYLLGHHSDSQLMQNKIVKVVTILLYIDLLFSALAVSVLEMIKLF